MKIFKNKWGDWVDIIVGQYGNTKIILQGRRHKNGKLEIREMPFKMNSNLNVDDLKKVKSK